MNKKKFPVTNIGSISPVQPQKQTLPGNLLTIIQNTIRQIIRRKKRWILLMAYLQNLTLLPQILLLILQR